MDERVVKSLEELVKVQKIAKDGVLSLDGAIDDLKNQLSECLAEIQETLVDEVAFAIKSNHCHLMLPVVWIWKEHVGNSTFRYNVFVGDTNLKCCRTEGEAEQLKQSIEESMGR